MTAMCGQPSKLVILPLTLFTPETSDRFDEGHLLPWPGLTATVTATAATAGKRQRPATVRNTRTIRANWGYVRPEKRKVDSSILSLTTSLTSQDVLDRAAAAGV